MYLLYLKTPTDMKNRTYKITEGTKTLVPFCSYITSPINKTLKLNTSEILHSNC